MKLINEEIQITDGREIYSQIKCLLTRESIYSKNKFIEEYYTFFNDANEYVDTVDDVSKEIIISSINKCSDIFISLGIYDFSYELLEYEDKKSETSYVLFSEVFEPIEEATEILEQEIYEREQRKNNRDKFVSPGGYGITDTLANSAKAGFFNFITEIGHEVFNEYESEKSGKKLMSEITSIYLSNEIKNKIASAIQKDILATIDIAYKYIKDNLLIKEHHNLNQDDIIKSDRILKNIIENRIPDDKIKNVLADCLKLNPYNLRTYVEYLIRYDFKEVYDYFKGHYLIKDDLLNFIINDHIEYLDMFLSNQVFEYSDEEKERIKKEVVKENNLLNEWDKDEYGFEDDSEKEYDDENYLEEIDQNEKNIEILAKILEKYAYSDYDKFYTYANPNLKKFYNCISQIHKEFVSSEGVEYSEDDVAFFVDETIFGSGKKGLSLMFDGMIFYHSDNSHCIHINEINNIEISGVLTRSLTIYSGYSKIKLEFLQASTKGVKAIYSIIKEYLNNREK